MSFTVVKKIGSGQVFTTLQGWEDGAPVNYSTAEKSAAGTFLTAAFVQGETLSFVGSGAAGKLIDTDSTGAGNGTYVSYGLTGGNPAASDVVTGATSGATCVLSSSTPTATACIWQGQINAASDVFTVSSGVALSISGGTVSSLAYAELTTATGASFRDNANAQTNALRYNTANGCAIEHTAAYAIAISNNQDFSKFSNLQIISSDPQGSASTFSQIFASGSASVFIDYCIIESLRTEPVGMYGSGCVVRSSLIVGRGSGKAGLVGARAGAAFRNCTLVTMSNVTKVTNIITGQYGAGSIYNCAFMWGTNLSTGTGPTYTTSANDNATPPSGVTQVAYSNATFVNTSGSSTHDYRLVSGSGLIGIGTVTANVPVDIVGTSQAVTNDIGCWHFVATSTFQAAWATQANVVMQSGAKVS